MSRIQCPWTSCRHNSSDENESFGECEFNGIVDLHAYKCEECNGNGGLSCESYEPYYEDEVLRLKQLEEIFSKNGYTEVMIEEIKHWNEATEIEDFINNLEEERSNWGE